MNIYIIKTEETRSNVLLENVVEVEAETLKEAQTKALDEGVILSTIIIEYGTLVSSRIISKKET